MLILVTSFKCEILQKKEIHVIMVTENQQAITDYRPMVYGVGMDGGRGGINEIRFAVLQEH